MDTNTDPVRAHDELRVQAALLRTPEFMAQFDPDKFAGQLERIAAALAQQPAAVDEAMVDRAGQALYGTDWGSFEGWEADQLRRKVRAVLTAALAAQPGGSDNDRA